MMRDNRKVLAALVALLLFSVALYAQTTLTFVQAQAKAETVWPGDAATLEIHQSGTTAVERWALKKSILAKIRPCMGALGSNWGAVMAIVPDCPQDVPPAVPVPDEPPFEVTLKDIGTTPGWLINGPFLVEDRDPFMYTPKSFTFPDKPNLIRASQQLQTALCDLQVTDPSAFQFLLTRGVKLRKPCL